MAGLLIYGFAIGRRTGDWQPGPAPSDRFGKLGYDQGRAKGDRLPHSKRRQPERKTIAAGSSSGIAFHLTRPILKALVLVGVTVALPGCNKAPQTATQEAPKEVPPKPADYNSRVGIAIQLSTGVCLAIANTRLAPNTGLSLVTPTQPQAVAEGVIAGAGPACPGVVDPGMSNYTVRIQQGKVEDDLVLIALLDSSKISIADHGAILVDLGSGSGPSAFRSCTSAEGVYVSVWSGKPLESARLWRGYYHLDYDAEPSCTEKDTAQ